MSKRAEIFEEIFSVDISNFSTAEDIDLFIQERRGIDRLKIVDIRNNVVFKRGLNVKLEKVNLNNVIDNYFSYPH